MFLQLHWSPPGLYILASLSKYSSFTEECNWVGFSLCGFFCPCIQAIKMAEKYGECFLLSHVPWTHFMLRTSIRERYNIEGTICDDWCVTAFCGPCVQCQMVREVNKEIPN
uniref:Uncharacterized protein n=1 Tax=Oncorhynchus mykiss TaxID=8022 RepID=A0A8C7S092_ONCMY